MRDSVGTKVLRKRPIEQNTYRTRDLQDKIPSGQKTYRTKYLQDKIPTDKIPTDKIPTMTEDLRQMTY